MAKFVPQSQTRTDTVRHINYTCSPARYSELENLATKSGISLKELLRQMVEFSLRNM